MLAVRIPLCVIPLVLLLLGVGCDASSDASGLQLLWRFDYQNRWATEPLPQVVGSDLVAIAGLDIVRLDLNTGEVVWQKPATDDMMMVSSGIAVGERHVLTAHIDDYRAFRLSDGEMVWKLSYNPNSAYLPSRYGRFASSGDKLFSLGEDGRVYAWSDADLSLRYRTVSLGDQPTSVTVVDGVGYVGVNDDVGYVAAFDVASGDTLWWREEQGGTFLAPLAFHNGIVYGSLPGQDRLRDLAFDAATGRKLWERPGAAGADFIYHEGTLYGNGGIDGGHAYARDAATGRMKWQTKIPGGAAQEIVAHGEYVYALDSYGLHVLEAATGEIVHVEPPVGGYWWNLTKAGDKIIAQSTTAIVAFKPYRP